MKNMKTDNKQGRKEKLMDTLENMKTIQLTKIWIPVTKK
jgi:hypothetical protein